MNTLLYLLILVVPLLADFFVKSRYKKYLKVDNKKNLSGQEVARMILDKHGLEKVYVVETTGTLSDHYDPTRKVVRLSHDIFNGNSVSAMAIASHECGHAIQDSEGYTPLRIRSAIYPIVNIATSISYYIIVLGIILSFFELFYLGIGLTGFGLLFQIVTLPVEFNASKRAEKELSSLNLVHKDDEEKEGVHKVLVSAALTYVAGVLASALQILRLLLLANDRD